jgi:hypothetical protein
MALTASEIDDQNTKRMFVGVLSNFLLGEQNLLNEDAQIGSRANQFETFEPSNGRTSVNGRTTRGASSDAPVVLSPMTLLLIGAAIYFVARNA